MLFLLLFAIPLLSFLLRAGVGSIWRYRKKQLFYGKADWFNFLLDYLIVLGLGLIPTIFSFCLFPRISLWGYSFIYFVLALLVMLFSPHRLIRKRGWEKGRARSRYLSLALLGLSLLELFAFNGESYRKGEVTLGQGEDVAMAIDYHGELGESEDGFYVEDGDYFVVSKHAGWDQNIAFEFIDAPNTTYYLHLIYSDDGKEFVNEWTFQVNPADTDSSILGLAGDSPYIKVEVEADLTRAHPEESLHLGGIYLNRSVQADFNLVRFGAFATLIAFVFYSFPICRHYGAFQGNRVRSVYVGAFAVTLAALLAFLAISLSNVDYFFLKYPIDQATLNDDKLTNIYFRLFDAFRKGRVSLDIKADPLLATLDNPYSPTEWHKVGASVHWDHAYFEGKYYAYYGAAPVLLVMFPVYWLSGVHFKESTSVALPVISLSINATVSEIEVGHSLTLIANVTGSAEKPVWSIEEKYPSSMDAEIDQNGVLNSGSVPGKVTVKASIEGISDEVIITVKEALVSVTIDNSVKEVEIGETAQLSATRSNDEPITWSIVEKNPTSIDAVIDSETGLLTAVLIKGTVKILAECGSASDTIDIDIIDPVPHWIDNANFGYRDPSTGLGYYLGERFIAMVWRRPLITSRPSGRAIFAW